MFKLTFTLDHLAIDDLWTVTEAKILEHLLRDRSPSGLWFAYIDKGKNPTEAMHDEINRLLTEVFTNTYAYTRAELTLGERRFGPCTGFTVMQVKARPKGLLATGILSAYGEHSMPLRHLDGDWWAQVRRYDEE